MRWMIALLAACMLWSCATDRSSHHSTSVVRFLFPEKQQHVEKPTIPTLHLPLRVGIAFVPEEEFSSTPIPEERKIQLLRKVKEHFSRYDFVHDIQVIPSAYLRPRGGFANLDQLATMFGIDVVALISYDQARFTDEDAWSISYWTLVGAYLVRGEKNDTHTMIDAAVYDIASRSLLFRAPGTSLVHSSATPVNLQQALRRDAIRGFDLASADLIQALDRELNAFRQRVKKQPEQYRIETREGFSMSGGAISYWDLLLLLGALGLLGRRLRG